MCGGGGTTTQSVQIPPEVLQRYNDVNARADTVASTPFKVYSNDANAFVAPLNETQQAGITDTNWAAGQAQPYYTSAAQQYWNGAAQSQPYYGQAAAHYDTGLAQGEQQTAQALTALNKGQHAAAPLQADAAGNIAQGLAAAQPYNAGAMSLYGAGLAGAQPLNAAANQNITGAQAGAQPYQALATQFGLAGAQGVNPGELSGDNINRYLSPYLGDVVGSTQALLGQQNQIDQSTLAGNAIKAGAFGGDRAGIASANLAQQQRLANNNILSGLLNTGYSTALNTAQQQQGLSLSAEQANRAALAGAAPQLAAIGQQGFGQGVTTAQQQAALGQQIFGQGLAGGSAIQGLGGQVYGQNTGTGQAQAALGQQLFGQGLASSQQIGALGQQLYNMQTGTGQAQQGLGGQLFSQGAQLGQNIAGLGNQAQTSALQGAQAQLAAGQTQQQTQQAGQTALYNQFLQQQSYPFQVAQFLANIAEGTGALSGSTTTTTQPTGIFSDKRLKSRIKKIGATFDGQPIYSYRYKDDPQGRTMMGLMAQDVEKAHPDAVGVAGGYRTVDYDKATQDAAKRGKFAGGGLARAGYAYGGYPMLPGMSTYDIEALMQGQGFAPYNSQGIYGGVAGGAPRGGQSYVPAANLPVAHLTVAGDIPKQPSAMEQIRAISDTGLAAAQMGEKAHDVWRKSHPAKPSDDGGGSSDEDPPYARGGRAGLAAGGDVLPYDDQIHGSALDIPDAKPDVKSLQTPGAPGGKGGGMGDVKDATSAALDVAKLFKMFLKTGGRVGFADGGAPEESWRDRVAAGLTASMEPPVRVAPAPRPAPPPPNPGGPGAGGQLRDKIASGLAGAFEDHDSRPAPHDRLNFDPIGGLASIITAPFQTAVRAGDLGDAVLGRSGPNQPHGASASWDAPAAPTTAPPQAGLAAAQPPIHRHTAVHATAPVVPQFVAGDHSPRGAGLAATPVDVQTLAPGVDRVAAPDTGGLSAGSMQGPEPGPNVAERAWNGVRTGPIGGYFGDLKHGDLPAWISLLSGIGAAGSVPTHNLGTALSAGLLGGAKGYMSAREAQPEIAYAKAQSETEQANAEAAKTWEYQYMARNAPANMVPVEGPAPDGKFIAGPKGGRYHYVSKAGAISPTLQTTAPPAAAGAQAAPTASEAPGAQHSLFAPSAGTTAFLRDRAGIDQAQNGAANQAIAFGLHPELKALDDKARETWQSSVGNLSSMDTTQRQLLQLSQSVNELSHTPTGQGHGSEYRTRLTNLAATAGQWLGVPLDQGTLKDLTNQQIIAKIKTLMGPAMAQQSDERAASIAKAITSVLPGGDLTPQAANELLSQMLIQTQKPRDYYNYGNEYSKTGLMFGVDGGFQRDVQPRYGHEQAKLGSFMGSLAFPQAMADLQSGDAAIRDRAIRSLDTYGGEGFHRYFTLGQ